MQRVFTNWHIWCMDPTNFRNKYLHLKTESDHECMLLTYATSLGSGITTLLVGAVLAGSRTAVRSITCSMAVFRSIGRLKFPIFPAHPCSHLWCEHTELKDLWLLYIYSLSAEKISKLFKFKSSNLKVIISSYELTPTPFCLSKDNLKCSSSCYFKEL